MYKNFVAAVIGLNGVLMLLIGYGIASTSGPQFEALGVTEAQLDLASVSYLSLAAADAANSVFSFAAAFFIIKENPAGRILALVTGAYIVLAGIGIYMLTGDLFGLYFIALRGAVIAGLAWFLKTSSTT